MISSICRCSALVHTPSRAEVAQTSSAILVGKRRVQRRNSVVSRAEVEIRSGEITKYFKRTFFCSFMTSVDRTRCTLAHMLATSPHLRSPSYAADAAAPPKYIDADGKTVEVKSQFYCLRRH